MSNNQRDMSHVPASDGVLMASVMTLPILTVSMLAVVFFSMLFIHASTPIAAKWALWTGIPISWLIYFLFIFKAQWEYVSSDEEVILEDTASKSEIMIDQTDPLYIREGLRSIGGPGYRPKSIFEEVVKGGRLKVKKKEIGDNVECDDANSGTYNLTYSLTYSRIRGRYSVIGAFYDEEEAVKTLKAIAQAAIEQKFSGLQDGREARADLEGFNKRLSEVMGGDREIHVDEIRCGFYITGVIVKKVDEESATKKRNQAATLTTAIRTALTNLTQQEGLKDVNPNLLMATAASLAGVEIKGVEVKIVNGLPPGSSYTNTV